MQRPDWIPVLIGLAAFALYGLTAARDIAWGDSVEFTLAATELGIPHPTGYPLYVLGTRVAALLPVGSLPWRVNLFSGWSAALAIVVCYGIARRLGQSRAAAATAALTLAVAREVWLQSTTAEVYTLHLLLVALALWAMCGWHRERDGRRLALAALIVGFGLAHHLTIVLIVPALLWLAVANRRLPPLHVACWVLLPPTLYLVLMLRSGADPSLDQGDPESLRGLITHLSGRQFRYRLFTSAPGYMLDEISRIGRLLSSQWCPIGLALSLVGVIHLARRHAAELVAMLLLAIAVTLYAAGYNIPDKDGYLLPVVLVLALTIGAGAEQLCRWLRPARARSLVAAALIVLPLAVLPLHRADADRHLDRSLRDLTLEAYGRAAPDGIILTDDTNTYFAHLYLQQAEGLLTDRQAILTYLAPLPWYLPSISHRAPPAGAADILAEVNRRDAAAAGLSGKPLGQRRGADQREIGGLLARRALATGRTFLYEHGFEETAARWQELALIDCGLLYELVPQLAAPADSVALDFRRAAHYSTARVHLQGERRVAKRYATTANREGIRRVGRGDIDGARRAFEQSVSHDPDYAQAWLNLGLLRADYLADVPGTRSAWQRYLELADDGPEAGGVRRRLATLGATRPDQR